nr:unnamed protein product [Callosobruchus chinensis]
MKAIAQSTGRTFAQVKADVQETGDFGLVAEKSKSNQKMLFKPARLTVRGVFEKLKEIAMMTGSSSQAKKIEKIQSMFVACQEEEARFLIRSLVGKLRIGLAEQSVLQALALAYTTTPPSECRQNPDSDSDALDVAKKMTADAFKAQYEHNSGVSGRRNGRASGALQFDSGHPVEAHAGPSHEGVQEVLHRFENLKFTCEWKYDGERAQIHFDGSSISIFSRNQENNTSKYPDIINRFDGCKSDEVKSCIVDSEVVAWDKEKKQILPFQILSTRKRKDAVEEDIKVQVCVYMFDLLYLNEPFIERRTLLQQHFKEVEGEWCFAKSMDTQAMEEVQDFLEEASKTLEKDATYEIAKRSRKWLKLKKDYLDGVGDTLDVVVIGGYLGKGKRTGTYGGGSGKGISLRFPRFIRIRDDKTVEDATTSQQIAHIYSSQEQVEPIAAICSVLKSQRKP